MNQFNHFLKKAVYLGVGLASYAGEEMSDRLAELAQDAQKKADEWVKRGEMTTEEARRFVNQVLDDAKEQVESVREDLGSRPSPVMDKKANSSKREPQTIDISFESEDRET